MAGTKEWTFNNIIDTIKMEKVIEVKFEDVKRAFEKAGDSAKESILTLFPQLKEILPITGRVKTFEDACHEIGIDPEQYMGKYEDEPADVVAYMKLRVICKALNEGWMPQFAWSEERWSPWFLLFTKEELLDKDDEWKIDQNLMSINGYLGDFASFANPGSSYAPFGARLDVSSCLYLKSKELADYCGKQFINLWADFYLKKK